MQDHYDKSLHYYQRRHRIHTMGGMGLDRCQLIPNRHKLYRGSYQTFNKQKTQREGWAF